MSCRAFIPPMVHAWCMHRPFSTLSQYSSAFEFPASMIHHHAMVPRHTLRPTCPPPYSLPTCSGPQPACHGHAIPSHPYHHVSLDAHAPWHTHMHTSTTRNPQPRYTTAATARLLPVTATAAIYVPPPLPSMCHRRRHLHVSPLTESTLTLLNIETPIPLYSL